MRPLHVVYRRTWEAITNLPVLLCVFSCTVSFLCNSREKFQKLTNENTVFHDVMLLKQ